MTMSAATSNTCDHVGYVLTHYPRTAQTFIAGEIDAVEREGMKISPFAMNQPDASELVNADNADRAAQTLYLKRQWLASLANLALLFLRHPFAMGSIGWRAIASASGNPARTVRRLAHLAQAARVAKAARQRGIGHLHAHFGLAPATIAWIASEILSIGASKVRFSFTIHGFHDFVDPHETRLDIKARHAARVICISDFTRSQLCLQTPPELWPCFEVVRCGIDLELLPFVPRAAHSGQSIILAVGRLSAEKGFAVLIEALAELRKDGADMKLRFVGDGPQRSELQQAVALHGLQEHVDFVGELSADGVRRELAAADIFCLPSFSEGLPVSIMEAMASGVPVVATWIAGIPELAENGVSALCVPPGRADALALALRRLHDEPQLGAQLARNGRDRVAALHDQQKSGASMADLFREMMA
jgi:colanic acid/amylovoran biosynthesis glycosyltransferase